MNLKTKIARSLYPLQSIRRVLRGPLRGMRFVVVPGMGVTYALGLDHWQFGFFQKQLTRGMMVYDVGANCGQMALFFSRQVGVEGAVLSFEPAPVNVETLRRNLAMNRCDNVRVFAAAVADDTKPRQFSFDDERHTMGTFAGTVVQQESWQSSFEVDCVTLDSVVTGGGRPPDLVKIDVEGAGLQVVKGGLALFEKHRPHVYFEVHAADEAAPELQALRLLRDQLSYRIHDLSGNPLPELGPVWGEAVWCQPAELSAGVV